MTTLAAVIAALLALMLPEQTPICVAVGAYKCAPVKIEVRCMTPDIRSGWWDTHQDASCSLVVTIRETSRVQARPSATDSGYP